VKSNDLRLAVIAAFSSPTLKQKEAYGRFAHTLAAANLIGAATLYFADIHTTVILLYRVAMMLTVGVLLFCLGALFSKGE
jgi:hypothetical protein